MLIYHFTIDKMVNVNSKELKGRTLLTTLGGNQQRLRLSHLGPFIFHLDAGGGARIGCIPNPY